MKKIMALNIGVMLLILTVIVVVSTIEMNQLNEPEYLELSGSIEYMYDESIEYDIFEEEINAIGEVVPAVTEIITCESCLEFSDVIVAVSSGEEFAKGDLLYQVNGEKYYADFNGIVVADVSSGTTLALKIKKYDELNLEVDGSALTLKEIKGVINVGDSEFKYQVLREPISLSDNKYILKTDFANDQLPMSKHKIKIKTGRTAKNVIGVSNKCIYEKDDKHFVMVVGEDMQKSEKEVKIYMQNSSHSITDFEELVVCDVTYANIYNSSNKEVVSEEIEDAEVGQNGQ